MNLHPVPRCHNPGGSVIGEQPIRLHLKGKR